MAIDDLTIKFGFPAAHWWGQPVVTHTSFSINGKQVTLLLTSEEQKQLREIAWARGPKKGPRRVRDHQKLRRVTRKDYERYRAEIAAAQSENINEVANTTTDRAKVEPPRIPGAKDEGFLNKALTTVLRLWGVPENQFKEIAAELERVAKARVVAAARPRWDERYKYDELRELSAPAFLKTVYGDVLGKGGVIQKQIVRQADQKLMAAVEVYIANRRAREQDAGDAKGLRLIAGPTSPVKAAKLG